jgi:hypothetical protein
MTDEPYRVILRALIRDQAIDYLANERCEQIADVLAPHVAALIAQARTDGEKVGAEAEYTAVYERHCRPVDPDLEGYATDELVGRLLELAEEKARAAGVAEERERISEACLTRRDQIGSFGFPRPAAYHEGMRMGLEDAGRIAREEEPASRPGSPPQSEETSQAESQPEDAFKA